MGFTSFHNDHGLLTGLADDDHTQYVLGNILTTDGDLFSRNAGAVTRIAAVATGQVLASAGTGTLPAWSASPTLTELTCPTLTGGTAANDDITVRGTSDSTNTTSYVFLQSAGGRIHVGATDSLQTAMLTLARANNDPSIKLLGAGANSATPRLDAVIGRNTLASPQASAANDIIFQFIGQGHNGTVYADSTGLYFEVDAAVGTQVPGRVVFLTTSATASLTERMRIDSTGKVGIKATSPTVSGTGLLHMNADTFRLDTARTPATAGAAGNAGDICWDASFIYVCTGTNAWERVGIASW